MIWLLQFLALLSSLGSGNTVSQATTPPLLVNGVLGESVTLPLKFSAEGETIIWLHNGRSIIIILNKQAKVEVTDPENRKDRLKVIQFSSLQINNLTMADSGHYRAQITSKIYDYYLSIFGRLRNLQVANHTQVFENGTCEIQLTCSVENPNDHVSLGWQVPGNTILEEANLTISWDPKNSSEEIYTCIAKNPVSNLSFSFSVQSLCKGVFNEENQSWIIILSVLVSVLILIIVSWFVRRKIVAGSLCLSTQQTESPAETSRDSGNDPTHPDNTVYAQVTHPNEKMEIPMPMKNNDSSTIYSTICQPKQPPGERT